MAHSRAGLDKPNIFCDARMSERLKKKKKHTTEGSLSEGHRNQFEGVPTGQSWDNINTKINMNSNGL